MHTQRIQGTLAEAVDGESLLTTQRNDLSLLPHEVLGHRLTLQPSDLESTPRVQTQAMDLRGLWSERQSRRPRKAQTLLSAARATDSCKFG